MFYSGTSELPNRCVLPPAARDVCQSQRRTPAQAAPLGAGFGSRVLHINWASPSSFLTSPFLSLIAS